MPTIVTATELRTILGVSSSLYNDAYLNDIIDAAEAITLPMLVSYSSRIIKAELSDDFATFTTADIHPFSVGQSVVITGVNATFNGTRTVTDTGPSYYFSFPTYPYPASFSYTLGNTEFTVAITAADVNEFNVIPSGFAVLSGSSTYVGNAAVEAAILSISVEIFQARTAAGGSIEGVDFSVSPYRLSKNLLAKVTGLLGPYLDTSAMVG
jgi:hypothetical protein